MPALYRVLVEGAEVERADAEMKKHGFGDGRVRLRDYLFRRGGEGRDAGK